MGKKYTRDNDTQNGFEHPFAIQPVFVYVREGLSVEHEMLALGQLVEDEDEEQIEKAEVLIEWGDGSSISSGSICPNGKFFEIKGSHSFPTLGRYHIKFELRGPFPTVKAKTEVVVGEVRNLLLAKLIKDLFGRWPSMEVFADWQRLLKDNLPWTEIVKEVQKAKQCQIATAEHLYESLLRRAPTQEETEEGCTIIRKSGSRELRSVILGSDDFLRRHAAEDPSQFLEALFKIVLGRNPTCDEMAEWTNDFTILQNRVATAHGFLTSPSAEVALLSAFFSRFIGRQPDSSLISDALSMINQSEEQFFRWILGFPEYRYHIFADVAMSQPDVEFQLGMCLDSFGMGTTLRELITNQVQARLTEQQNRHPLLWPAPLFESLCSIEGDEKAAVWRDGGSDDLARQRALTELDIRGEAFFALLIRVDSLEAMTSDAWANQPKDLGQVHLSGFEFTIQSPNKLITTITGAYHATSVIDVDFTVTFTEQLSLDDEGFLIVQTTKNLDADTSLLEAPVWLFVPLPGAVAVQEYINEKIDSVTVPDVKGPGAAVAELTRSLRQFLLAGPKLQKIVFAFDDLSVDPASGILLSGGLVPILQLRKPAVVIHGDGSLRDPQTIPGPTNKTSLAVAWYWAEAIDLRPPLTFLWKSSAQLKGAMNSNVQAFFLVAKSSWGSLLSSAGKLSVQISDADGVTVSASLDVDIEYTHQPPPPGLIGHVPPSQW